MFRYRLQKSVKVTHLGGAKILINAKLWQVYALNHTKKLRKHFFKQFRLFLELLLLFWFSTTINLTCTWHNPAFTPMCHIRSSFSELNMVYISIYINIYIYIMSVQVRKKAYSLCLVFWGNYKTGNILYDENPNEETQDI